MTVSRVLVTARKFEGLGVRAAEDLVGLETIEQSAREIRAGEMRGLPAAAPGEIPVA